jgi:ABC-type nitrate/sulfonate/bicarbonate transport system permease component
MRPLDASADADRRRAGRTRLFNLGLFVGPLVLFVAAWEASVSFFELRLVPPPSAVGRAMWDLIERGQLQQHTFASVRRALVGFVLAGSAAILVGMITGRIRVIRLLFEPLIQLFRPIPAIAWVPFSILWFGVGEVPKIFVIFMGVFFPVWVNVHLGARGIEKRYIEVAENLDIRGPEQFWRIVLPGTLPHIVSGLRIGFAIAFILLVAAELTGTSVGLGALISISHINFRVDRMVAGMVMLGLLGALADWLFARGVRRVSYWEN